jgi:hypothetical protein
VKHTMRSPTHRALASASRCFLLCLALFLGITAQIGWAQAPPDVETLLKKMLTATESGSRSAFVADGDASFQTDITPPMFGSFSAQFAPRLKRGYTTTFVTQLHQEGYSVYVWKVEFKDGGDDLLFTLAVKDGKVGGFFLR